MVGIVALPPSILFISEYLIIKQMILSKDYLLCILFLLLLTIILFGISKSVIKMAFTSLNTDRTVEVKNIAQNINWAMYYPQIILLGLAFSMGLFFPKELSEIIILATAGF